MVEPISVPYRRQRSDGYCLPACVQMALAHLGITRSQDEMARVLGIVEDLGAPVSHVLQLRSRQIHAEYHTEGSLDEVRLWLARRVPVIACVQTGQLGYWHGRSAQHVVLIVGIEGHTVYVLDPAIDEAILGVSVEEFMLAWDEMSFAFAVIFRL